MINHSKTQIELIDTRILKGIRNEEIVKLNRTK